MTQGKSKKSGKTLEGPVIDLLGTASGNFSDGATTTFRIEISSDVRDLLIEGANALDKAGASSDLSERLRKLSGSKAGVLVGVWDKASGGRGTDAKDLASIVGKWPDDKPV